MNLDTDFFDFIGNGVKRALIVLCLTIALITLFIAIVKLPNAVIAQGTVTTLHESRIVQHDTGGIISKIHVAPGVLVNSGDPLLEFDTIALEAEREALVTELVVISSERESILSANKNSNDHNISDTLMQLAQSYGLEESVRQEIDRTSAKINVNNHLSEQINGERKTLIERRKKRIQERNAKLDELTLVQELISRRSILVEQGIVAEIDLKNLHLDEASLRGEIARLSGDVTNLSGAIANAESDAERLPHEQNFERLTRLSELSRQIADRQKRLVQLEQSLSKATLRAPVSGQVIKLSANTIGSFAPPAQELSIIAPLNEDLIIDVKLDPRDIDSVKNGMTAKVVFSVFPQRDLPELTSQIENITNDVVLDKVSGRTFYHARLKIPDAARLLDNNHESVLLSGMPVDVFITVNKRTILEYILSPLQYSFRNSFRA